MPSKKVTVRLHRWGHKWITEHFPYKIGSGGRISGKTHNISMSAIMIASGKYPDAFHKPPVRFICLREKLNSIEDSVKYELESRISELGLDKEFYKNTKNEILHHNKSMFRFRGLSRVNNQTIKGFANFDVAWVEEGHELSHKSLDLLIPTILRKDGAEIWISMNPDKLSDAAYEYFIAPKNMDGRLLVQVNYDSNPDLSDNAKRTIETAKKTMPEKFAHIYLGQPDTGEDRMLILTLKMVQACIDAWPMRPTGNKGTKDAGLDIAGKGSNKNALVIRDGPCIEFASRISKTSDRETYDWAFHHCTSLGALRMYFDQGGVGANMQARHNESVNAWEGVHYPLAVVPTSFGGKVEGAEELYVGTTTNGEYFEYRNGQMAWMLKLRAQNTLRLLNGEKVDPDNCLFINPDLPEQTLNDIKKQFTQPEYQLTKPGKVSIDKDPHSTGSPDLWDGACLAFARDSEFTGIDVELWLA